MKGKHYAGLNGHEIREVDAQVREAFEADKLSPHDMALHLARPANTVFNSGDKTLVHS